MNTATREYYEKVGSYFDEDSSRFEEVYWTNETLQSIRQSFREEVKRYSFHNVLEIGTGPGIDICHFAAIYPEVIFFGIDVSAGMLRHASEKAKRLGLDNIHLEQGSTENISQLFPGEKFDMIYVFFGALNTIETDLKTVFSDLSALLTPSGTMVLSFVNKWYLAEMGINLLKLNPQKAFKRLQKVWHGYSGARQVESRCYSPTDIQNALTSGLEITKRRGFSIAYPAWYRNRWVKKMGKTISRVLWKTDLYLNKTFLWKFGEYTLYVIRKT